MRVGRARLPLYKLVDGLIVMQLHIGLSLPAPRTTSVC